MKTSLLIGIGVVLLIILIGVAVYLYKGESTIPTITLPAGLTPGCYKANDSSSSTIYRYESPAQKCKVVDQAQYSVKCGIPWTAHTMTSSHNIIGDRTENDIARCV